MIAPDIGFEDWMWNRRNSTSSVNNCEQRKSRRNGCHWRYFV